MLRYFVNYKFVLNVFKLYKISTLKNNDNETLNNIDNSDKC